MGIRTLLTLLAALSLAAVVPATPAAAHDSLIVTLAFRYVPAEITITQGDSLTYGNLDVAPHNVVAEQVGADGQPLFESPILASGQTATVDGVPNLPPGSYGFFCTLHEGMRGRLNVEPRPGPMPAMAAAVGTVVSRPLSPVDPD